MVVFLFFQDWFGFRWVLIQISFNQELFFNCRILVGFWLDIGRILVGVWMFLAGYF